MDGMSFHHYIWLAIMGLLVARIWLKRSARLASEKHSASMARVLAEMDQE
jgi:hypothetical protein